MGLFEEKNLSPMLIAQMQEPFNDDGWIYELKLDGCRCIGYFDQSGTCLRNKRNMELLPKFPELKELHHSVSELTVLDGELVVLQNGVPDFFELQRRTLLTDRFKIDMAAARHPASFVAYDCLCEGSRSIMDRPLLERKELLQTSVRKTDGSPYPVIFPQMASAYSTLPMKRNWREWWQSEPPAFITPVNVLRTGSNSNGWQMRNLLYADI